MDLSKLDRDEMLAYIQQLKIQNHARYEAMKKSIDYYNYKHDILGKKRIRIGENGEPEEITYLPNAKEIDNQFAKAVDNKVNYIFSSPPVIRCKQDLKYQELIQGFYDNKLTRTMNRVALEAVLCGISWLYVYPDSTGQKLKYEKRDTLQIIPIWKDKEHEKLQGLLYEYVVEEFIKGKIEKVRYTEFYTETECVTFKESQRGALEEIKRTPYIKIKKGEKEENYHWGKIPFIYFKANKMETPLLNRCKPIQDAINLVLSNFEDSMLEDGKGTIFILKNYDGQDLGEFRHNVNTFSAIKVETYGDAPGGVDTLEVTVNAENYRTILEILKEKLIENTRSIDTKNNKNSQARNQLDIKTMYSDMELDANEMEMEFRASFSYLEYFFRRINNISEEVPEVDIELKRNITISDESTVEIIKNSVGILSNETLIANHPFTDNVAEELEAIKKEKEENSLFEPFSLGVENETEDLLE